jgi:hypothetical protein
VSDSMMTARRIVPEPAPARLEMRWMPVTDTWGQTRMVATWIDSSTTSAPSTHHAA